MIEAAAVIIACVLVATVLYDKLTIRELRRDLRTYQLAARINSRPGRDYAEGVNEEELEEARELAKAQRIHPMLRPRQIGLQQR